MAINKVIYGGNTLIDLTADTVIASGLQYGLTAHDKSGAAITGTNTYDADTSDADAGVAEILATKTAYVNGTKLTGTMPNRGSVTGTISAGDTYTIPEGYHDGTGTVTATGGGGSIAVVYANGGGNTSSAYNSSVLDVGEVGNTCYYQFGGGGANAKTFSVQGSLNNSSWTTITSTSNSANRITGFTGNNSEYRYYRLHVNAGTASATNGYRGMMACVDLGGNSTNAFSPVEETM